VERFARQLSGSGTIEDYAAVQCAGRGSVAIWQSFATAQRVGVPTALLTHQNLAERRLALDLGTSILGAMISMQCAVAEDPHSGHKISARVDRYDRRDEKQKWGIYG
jgi:hypothetical protein